MAEDADMPGWMKQAGIADPKWALPKGKRGAEDEAGSVQKLQKAEDIVEEAKGKAGKGANRAQVVAALVAILGKLVLSMAGDLRAVISVVFVTALVPTTFPCIEAAIKAGKDYHTAAMKLREESKEDDKVDTAKLGSPHLHVWKDFIRALLASTEEGKPRDILTYYWRNHIMRYELVDAAAEVKYFRVRTPQGKEKKKSKRMEGKVRLQWALTMTNKTAAELDEVLRAELIRQGAEITIGAAPRGVLERDARALSSSKEAPTS
ncbi:unnamed protein product [Prorocentrum cordatum]|uniref:Uncharacterized protein n=1 Tax=Prorocentrum cordatum TaxID=2364126 RepID=A0ABN9RK14_9DINO|nr:unnamed protein product [Polarella glacialis]